jgi:outer membrane protein assembly factor BamB
MAEFGEFESGFADFETELEEFEVKKTRKWDRVFRLGEGGSFCFTLMHEGVIYATCGDHYVYAIDGKNGRELWKFRAHDRNYGAPSTDGRLVFVPSYDTHLYALDIKTGGEVWKFKTGGKLFSTPGVWNGMVFFGSEDENMYAVSAASGRLLWRFRTGGFIASTVTFYDGRIFFGACDHNFYCLDAKTGREEWRFVTGDDIQINRQLTISGGRLYFASMDNYLYCLDVKDGKEIWRFRTGKYGNVSTPSLYRDKLYHSTRDGIIYALTLDGKEVWRFQASGFIAKNLVHEGVVYFGSEDTHFYALDAETGKELWRFRTGAFIFDDAKIVGNLVCFGGWDCNYYAVDRKTGKEAWRFRSSSQQIAFAPPVKSEYVFEIKRSVHVEDAISEEKYKNKKADNTVSLSDYQIGSEYHAESGYKQKSDYSVNFVILDSILEEEEIWISDLKEPNLRTLKRN